MKALRDAKQKQTKLSSVRYWIGVIVVGLVIGGSLKFALAWTNPTQTPPNGNVSGPITTGIAGQVKLGALGINGVLTSYSQLNARSAGASDVGITLAEWSGATIVQRNRIIDLADPINDYDAANLRTIKAIHTFTRSCTGVVDGAGGIPGGPGGFVAIGCSATCPSGSWVTGGGAEWGYVFSDAGRYFGPDFNNGYKCVISVRACSNSWWSPNPAPAGTNVPYSPTSGCNGTVKCHAICMTANPGLW